MKMNVFFVLNASRRNKKFEHAEYYNKVPATQERPNLNNFDFVCPINLLPTNSKRSISVTIDS